MVSRSSSVSSSPAPSACNCSHSPFGTATKDHSPPPILNELRDLSDFHAAQAQFEVTVDLEKDVKYVPSAIAGERVQFIGIGTVDAVVDFDSLGAGAVKVSRRRQVRCRHPAEPRTRWSPCSTTSRATS